jgi:hypothetical protein
METTMTYGLASSMQATGPFTDRGFTGATVLGEILHTAECDQRLTIRKIVAARAVPVLQQRNYEKFPDVSTERTAGQQILDQEFPEISAERTASQQIFGAIQVLYLSSNRPRDRQIADRIATLHRDAIAEGDRILPESLGQFTDFFLEHRDLDLPKITLTPDGTLRVRWIRGPGNFVAIEFTGAPLAKMVAEIPRDNGLTARHFSSEPVKNIRPIARAIGALFT